MPGPPTMFSALLDHPRRQEFDLSTLGHAIIGAASIPSILVRRMRDELGIGWILSAYGLTENHTLATLTAPDDPPEVVATTVGRPLADIELRLADDAGREVPAGSEGEVLLRGPFLFSGYYDDEEATRRTVVDGWLHTGDVGRFDEDGYVHITDRKKDMFIVGGFNVAPAEVEKSIMAMPGVSQVAVVGMPDDYFGEVGAAFVIPFEGTHMTPDDVVTYARGHLANFKVPRRVEIVETLPMNATGKVLKTELRRRLERRPVETVQRLRDVAPRGRGGMARYDRSFVHPMSTELVAAEDVGVDPKRLDLFLARVRLEVEPGPLPECPGRRRPAGQAGRVRDLRRCHQRDTGTSSSRWAGTSSLRRRGSCSGTGLWGSASGWRT